jgi:hypothetical protein
MNGFGFIEYKDAMDARDVVPGTYPRSRCYLTLRVSRQLYLVLSILETC